MKNQTLAFLTLILSSWHLYCQDTLSRWSIGGQLTGLYSDRAIRAESEWDDVKSFYDSLEQGMIGFRMGATVSYRLNDWVDISSDINFLRAGYSIDTLREAGIANMKFRYNFVHVPLRVSVSFLKGRVNRPFISLGLATNYCISDKTTFTQFGQATVIEINDKKTTGKFFHEMLLSAGISKTLNASTQLRLCMDAAYMLTPLAEGNLARRLWNMGARISLTRYL